MRGEADHGLGTGRIPLAARGTARLYGATEPGPRASVVMAHGPSAAITTVADSHAEVFAAAGATDFIHDHRDFGQSGGEPGRRSTLGYRRSAMPSRWPPCAAICGSTGSGSRCGATAALPLIVLVAAAVIDGAPPWSRRYRPAGRLCPMPARRPSIAPSLLTPIHAFRWFIQCGGRHGSGRETRATGRSPYRP